jgi:hypothetical protein
MSQKCPHVCEKATSRPRWNTGAANTMSGEWETPPREPWQSLYQYRSPGRIEAGGYRAKMISVRLPKSGTIVPHTTRPRASRMPAK